MSHHDAEMNDAEQNDVNLTGLDSTGVGSNEANVHFIISAPRSGSTWLSKALGQHASIFATENRLFGDYARMLDDAQGNPLPRITFDKYARCVSQHFDFESLDMNRAQFLRSFQRAYCGFLVRYCLRQSAKAIIVDKVTPYEQTIDTVLGGIQNVFPKAKLIHLVRDGRDVATSGAFDWLCKDAVGTDRYNFFVDDDKSRGLRRFFDEELIEKWANNWCEINQPFLSTELAGTTVRYESMQLDLGAELRKVFKLLSVDASESVCSKCVESASFERMSGRKQGEHAPLSKARKGVVGDWKNYFTRADGELFHRHAGEQLLALGYETDDTWYRKLPLELEIR